MRLLSLAAAAVLLVPVSVATDARASDSRSPTEAHTTQTTQGPFTIHLSPTGKGGDDDNDGLSTDSPINSLRRAQEVLRQHDPDRDVEIRIEQGTYVARPFHEWRTYIPGHTISFMPVDYVRGEGFPDGGLPVFRNAKCGSNYCKGFWLQPRLPKDTDDPMYDGGNSGLKFYYLRVERYSAGGVSIYGNSERDVTDESYDPPLRVPGSKGLNGNTFFGMQFRKLGNKWSGGDNYGYGAIVLTNSSDNRIVNNHFVNIENASPYGGYIHGAYVTHHSTNTDIERNKFAWISGNPVKVRNQSHYTTVENNRFTRTGRTAYYEGEFCDIECVRKHDNARQCASYHNRFFHNTVNSGYDGGWISDWDLDPDGLTNAGGGPCSMPDDEQRVRTGYNEPANSG